MGLTEVREEPGEETGVVGAVKADGARKAGTGTGVEVEVMGAMKVGDF